MVVERFDIDPEAGARKGFEDFCSLLGLPPDNKYDATWERVARLARDYVAPAGLRQANEQLAVTLLLTYALGNADCHTKNLAFVYSSFDDVQVAPIYDMLTILAYDRYADNPPGMYVDGRKSWDAGKANWRFLQQHLGVEPARQRELADLVATSISEQVPEVLHHMKNTPGFAAVGGRMLWEWQQGVKRLMDRITVPVPDLSGLLKAAGFGEPTPPPKFAVKRIDESPLLAPRKRTRPTRPS